MNSALQKVLPMQAVGHMLPMLQTALPGLKQSLVLVLVPLHGARMGHVGRVGQAWAHEVRGRTRQV